MNDQAMEAALKALVGGNRPDVRRQHAIEAKEKGKKVIGTLCLYTPEEVLCAAGMFPWRITGTWDSDLAKASIHRDLDTCQYCSHVIEALLRGDLDVLDGVLFTDWDDDRRRLVDTWSVIQEHEFIQVITAPRSRKASTVRLYEKDLSDLISVLEAYGGKSVSREDLWQAIELYSQTRSLLAQLYDLRKRSNPPITGAEVLGITTACMVMDKADFNPKLEQLLPYLQTRDTGNKADGCRLLVSADMLDDPAFFEIIEGEGCRIVMDDLDTGSRYVYGLVDTNETDPVKALAKRYSFRPADPACYNWDQQVEEIKEWVAEFRADGIIELFDEYSPPRQWRSPLLLREFRHAGIPFTRISREYHAGGVEQLRTRAAAFLEMIGLEI